MKLTFIMSVNKLPQTKFLPQGLSRGQCDLAEYLDKTKIHQCDITAGKKGGFHLTRGADLAKVNVCIGQNSDLGLHNK